ncbi:MAG: jag [Patescibacteria group bacterium]|jgi:spoIIIJ-associated protein|nr:jag [Patescibacteria group bacterium]
MNDTTLVAKQRLEELVSFFGANVDVEAELTEDGIELNIVSSAVSPRLIGHRGETLRAIEFLLNQMIKRHDGAAPRILVDIAGYKQARRNSLQELAQEIAARVKESGAEEELKPMNPAERRIVHMVLREIEGVDTESRGEDRDRRIVVKPAN